MAIKISSSNAYIHTIIKEKGARYALDIILAETKMYKPNPASKHVAQYHWEHYKEFLYIYKLVLKARIINE